MTLDQIIDAFADLYGPGVSILVTATRVRATVSGEAHLVACERVAGETPEQTIARDLVANGELAQIIARRDAAVAEAAARLAAAQARAADSRRHVEALMRAANGVTP